jgi:hypothetical protein
MESTLEIAGTQNRMNTQVLVKQARRTANVIVNWVNKSSMFGTTMLVDTLLA